MRIRHVRTITINGRSMVPIARECIAALSRVRRAVSGPERRSGTSAAPEGAVFSTVPPAVKEQVNLYYPSSASLPCSGMRAEPLVDSEH